MKVCEVLISSAFPDDNGANKYWSDSSKSLLSTLIRTLKNAGPKYANLANVRHLLNHFGSDGKGLDALIFKYADQQTYDDYEGFRSNSDRVLSNIVSTARTAVDAFSDPNLCKISSSETLRFETLRAEATIIYLIVPSAESAYYSFWLSLVYTAIFNYASIPPAKGNPYLPIVFLLDEVGTGSRIPDFSVHCNTLRKFSCQIVLALQHHSQLETLYGRAGAKSILDGGISTKIFLPGLNLETCQDLERILGRQTLEDRDTGRQFSRSLMTADEIRTMDDHKGVLVSGNSHPAKLRMKPFYKRRKFNRYSKIPPPEIVGSANSSPDYINLHSLPDVQGSDIIPSNGIRKAKPPIQPSRNSSGQFQRTRP